MRSADICCVRELNDFRLDRWRDAMRGVEFLLRTQIDDGSWHVVTRATPVHWIFDSGFPHGKDQWISNAPTSWATPALALANR